MLALVLACPMVAAGSAQAGPRVTSKYVALGDSFTSSPLTGMPIGTPVGCSRTQNNYPRQVANALGVSEFVDRSCGSATTRNLFEPQSVLGGTNAAQLDAVTVDTTLVSIGIGGNDLGLAGLVQRCVQLAPGSGGCLEQWSPGDIDLLVRHIGQVAVHLDRALRQIQQRVPLATVLVVGYPMVAPAGGIGCFPQLPIADSDVAYLRDIQQRLNTTLAWVAQQRGVAYVDTYTSSIDHGPCEIAGVKWIEGMVPDNPAAVLHPNALGQTAMAAEVLATFESMQ